MNLPENKILIATAGVIVLILILAAGWFFFLRDTTPADNKKPELHLTNLAADEWLSTNEDKVTLNGLAADESGIESIKWETQNGISGLAVISGGEWSIENIPLEQGDNQINITATDKGGNNSTTIVNIVYNADILFSDLTLSQDFIYKDEFPTQITTRAAVETNSKEGIGKVNLYKVVSGQNEKLAEMLDNGVVANGDDIPGDTVFSGIDSFSSTNVETIQLRVGASIGNSNNVAYSGILKLKVLNKPSQDSINGVFDLNKEFSARFEELKKDNDPKQATKLLVEELSQRSEIEVAGVAEDGFGVWWKYKETGILAGINNNPEGTRGDKDDELEDRRDKARKREAQQIAAGSVQGITSISTPINFGVSQVQAAENKKELEVKSTKAIYLGPYFTDFGASDDYHKGWQEIKNSKCPECQTTEKKDHAVTVEDFKTLSQYGLVIIPSHGDTWFNGTFAESCVDSGTCPASLQNGRGFVITWTNQQITSSEFLKYLPDLVNYRLALDASDNTLAILPPFISAYNGTFPNSLVYIGTCRSTHNLTMAAAYLSKGAKAYFGFSEYVDSDYASEVANEMLKSFKEEGKTASEAFADAVTAKGDGDANTPKAFFNFVGSPDLQMGGRKIQNASFEEGLVGWQTEGDSRVISRLASLKPRDGKKMAIISTGLGSVNQSNSALIQKICSTEGNLKISFKYNVISEEPLEYFGSVYDDNFVMTVTINGRKTTLVQKTINNSKWKKISGIDFAGGDTTTFHTGWKTVSKDLGKINPDDKIEIEFRVGDKGDSIYDTAALIDAVKLEVD